MKIFLVTLVYLLFAVVCSANENQTPNHMPSSLDLDRALELALKGNPSLQQARIGLISRDAAVREIRAAALPKLVGTGNYTRYDEQRLQAFGPDSQPDDKTWTTKAEASMPIFSGGRNRFAIQGAKFSKIAAEYNLRALEQDLIVMVQETYLHAVLAKAAAAAQQEEIDMLNDEVDRAKKRLVSGVGSRFEVLQAEVLLANAKPTRIRELNNYRREVDRLSRLLGLPLESTQEASAVDLKSPEVPRSLSTTMSEALALASVQRPELAELTAAIVAEEKQMLVDQRGAWPLLEIFGNYGIQSDQFGGDNLKGWTGGLRVNWSFYDGGARRAKVDQAKAQLDIFAQQRKELLLQISGEVREALYDYEDAWEIFISTEKVTEQAEEALRMSQDRYDSGKGTQLDVFAAQTQLTKARLDRIRTAHSCLLADARLQRALGE